MWAVIGILGLVRGIRCRVVHGMQRPGVSRGVGRGEFCGNCEVLECLPMMGILHATRAVACV